MYKNIIASVRMFVNFFRESKLRFVGLFINVYLVIDCSTLFHLKVDFL